MLLPVKLDTFVNLLTLSECEKVIGMASERILKLKQNALSVEEKALVLAGNFTKAVVSFHNRTGLTLVASKEFVDAYREERR